MHIDYLNVEPLGPINRWRLVVILREFGMLDPSTLPDEAARLLAAGADDAAVVNLAVLAATDPVTDLQDSFEDACAALSTHVVDVFEASRVLFRIGCRWWLDNDIDARLPQVKQAQHREAELYWEVDDIYEQYIHGIVDERSSARPAVELYLQEIAAFSTVEALHRAVPWRE